MKLETLREELEASVDRHFLAGCWIWTRGANGKGYGWLRVGRERMFAHRLAFYLANGYLPAVVRHSCDTPRCVNPDHLLPGTQADNVRDMVERDRSVRGERNVHAKITRSDAIAIRERYAAGGISQKALGAEFGIKQPTVSNIIAGRFWGWLTP